MKRMLQPGLWWIADLFGAAAFALGLAQAIGALVDGMAVPLAAYAWLAAGGVIRAGSIWQAQLRAATVAQGTVAPIREQLVRRLLAEPMAQPMPIGRSTALATDHVDRIEAHEARFRPLRLSASAGPLIVAALVALASPVAAAILLATLVPFVLGMILAGTMARRAADEQLEALATLSDLFIDRLRSLPMIRHFGAGERITRQVGQATRATATRTMAVLRIAFLSSAVLEFFAALSVALVAVYCGFSLLGLLPMPVPEALTFREAMFALAMAPEFYLPMRRLAAAYHEKQLGEAAREAIAPVLGEAVQRLLAQGGFSGLSVRNLEIDWPGRSIGPVSLSIGITGMVAIAGPTGSGKTSVLAALAGQIAATRGLCTPVPPHAIAWAAQRPLMLPDTLRANLVLAHPDVADAEITEACRMVGLDRLIGSRAEGLDLILDHHASGLSGGERRRLGLARAILSGRPLMLCDEPTADLDPESAGAIVRLLTELAKTHALVVATHDPDLMAAADRLVRL